MTENVPLQERIMIYFTRNDLLIIVGLALIAFLTSNFGLGYILPGGSAPGLVHGFLKLPGPGAGIFISSAFICIWLVLGLLLLKKPGTAILMAALVMIMSLVLVFAGVGNVRIDYLALVVAIIIECAGMLPLDQKPWRFVFPSVIALLGLITLALMLTGNAKMGEDGAAATVFPLGYAVSGILAIGLAVICYSYPKGKYIIGAGCAEVFYIVFCWLFNGKKGFASWVPVVPAIPALLTFAFVCGALMAAIAYGFYLLWNSYAGHGASQD
jgi:hypothetical protein